MEFLEKAAAAGKKEDINLIGQFGVGFYSAFMVASQVRVESRSARNSSEGTLWISDGVSNFTVEPRDGLPIGTSVHLTLKDESSEFAAEWRIRDIIQKYSNFVPFPIKINGETVNTIQALWTRNPSEISQEKYNEFYKFTAAAGDDPLDNLHFITEAPLNIKALLFFPDHNPESLGLGRIDPNINLYCKKILIQRHAKDLLPQWLRFIVGVVDSEDIPLNISRETMQDSALMRKISRILTRKIIRHLKESAEKQPDTYRKIWDRFATFIKEGVITEFSDRDALAELLRFETSMTDAGQLTSLAEYLERMPESQKEIYYITGASREAIESGPYIEVFKKQGIEVIYNYDPVDDFVMHHLAEYTDKKLISADSENIQLPEMPPDTPSEESSDAPAIGKDEIQKLTDWIRSRLQDKILNVKPSDRLVHSPMILVNPEGAPTGAMQKLMEAAGHEFTAGTKRNLQFNPHHASIKKLNTLRNSNADLATLILDQLFDHAALDAGIAVETRSLVDRMTRLIDTLLDASGGSHE